MTRVTDTIVGMRQWSDIADAIASTRSTTAKVATVAGYLRSLDPDSLPVATVFLSGRPFPETDARTTGIGWRALSDVVSGLAAEAADRTGATPLGLGAAYDRSSDLGTAVFDLLESAGYRPVDEPPTLPEVAASFVAIAAARGAAAKGAAARALLARCDAATARAVVKVLSGELRIGLRQGHLEAAIASAFGRDLAAVQWAGMLTGDIGRTAVLARDDLLDSAELSLFHPLTCMLASPVADEAEALSRMPPPVWVEDKYDGIRAQLHKLGAEVRLYSRDLNDVSEQFPEVLAAAAGSPWEGILDGEVLAWRDGSALPFQQLQGRLGRKRPSQQIQADVPVIYVGFDVLALGDGAAAPEPLLRLPLRQRRARLEALGLERVEGMGLAALTSAAD